MARRNQFLNLVTMLRDELGRSTNVAVGVSDLGRLKYQINKAYSFLVKDHDWPHLRRTFEPIELQAGQRYYDMPDELDYERVEGAWTWWSGQPEEVTRGIEMSNYALHNSENDDRSSPALRWDIRDVDGHDQIEVWPIPANDVETLQFQGIRNAPRLVNDSDLCLLDDYLVVVKAALAVATNKDDIVRLNRELETLYAAEKANSKSAIPTFSIGNVQPRPGKFSGVTIRVGG